MLHGLPAALELMCKDVTSANYIKSLRGRRLLTVVAIFVDVLQGLESHFVWKALWLGCVIFAFRDGIAAHGSEWSHERSFTFLLQDCPHKSVSEKFLKKYPAGSYERASYKNARNICCCYLTGREKHVLTTRVTFSSHDCHYDGHKTWCSRLVMSWGSIMFTSWMRHSQLEYWIIAYDCSH